MLNEQDKVCNSSIYSFDDEFHYIDIIIVIELFHIIQLKYIGQPKTYYMYWNNSEKTWWIGESLTNNKALMKMQSNSSLKCPADPLGVNERKKKWQRISSGGNFQGLKVFRRKTVLR